MQVIFLHDLCHEQPQQLSRVVKLIWSAVYDCELIYWITFIDSQQQPSLINGNESLREVKFQ